MPEQTITDHAIVENVRSRNDHGPHIIDHARSSDRRFVDHAPHVIIDQIPSGHSLQVNESITSFNEKYKLVMQVDGNLVLYRMSDMQSLWDTATVGSGAVQVVMKTDGNLVLYTAGTIPFQGTEMRTHAYPTPNSEGVSGLVTESHLPGRERNPIRTSLHPEPKATELWKSNTQKNAGAFLKLQNDGNLVIFKGTASKWTSNSWSKLAEQKIPERYAQIGGCFSGLGLPIDNDLNAQQHPLVQPDGAGGQISYFRGGTIKINGGTFGEPVTSTTDMVRLYFVGLECRIKQETPRDNIYGSVGVIKAQTKTSTPYPFPTDTDYWSLGDDGSRVVRTETLIYDDVPGNILLNCSLVEHDSGDIGKYKSKIAELLAEAAKSGLGAVGVPAETTAANQGFISDITLGLVNLASSALGADDDLYTPQALLIEGRDLLIDLRLKHGEIQNVPSPFKDDVLERADTPGVKLNYNLPPVIVSGTDQGGDRGEYGFYFRVYTYRKTEEA